MNTKILSAAIAFLGTALGAALPAQAATISKTMFIDPSTACQLSIPTTDTRVRPRATGYRNEGATTIFAICGTSAFVVDSDAVQYMQLQLRSIDGATHNGVSCTAVNRGSDGDNPFYSTKLVDVSDDGDDVLYWYGSDLGGFLGFASSVTCVLPPGVAITGIRLLIDDEVGA